MTPHIATATFSDQAHADDAREYLLGNEFLEEDITLIPAASGPQVIMNIKTATERLAQEAVDVLRNYGGVDIGWYEVK
ncbi:hypothetical protein [Mucilaginibacter pedocola]|uniref:Uncharacterized protein n=1 Tax=Mucilaginibacter pedocola TaxID=1792845 RepID=A0A1S9PJI8_9SPHI|nr:hypothetical protein [Mucilaginibacter pedocola]OOQ61130.1 hypothetical protein BC343_22065 [Mucilaginibacter pedocola]